MQKTITFNVAIVSVKASDYRIHLWYMSRNDAINIMENLKWKKLDHYNFFIIIYKMGEATYYKKKQKCYTK